MDELVGRPGAAGIEWVNDVVVRRRKIAGALAWAQSRGAVLDSVVLGIGLNVERVPEGVADAAEGATAIVDYQPTVTLSDALGALLRHLDQAYSTLASGQVDLVHDLERLDVDPVVEGVGAVISGHTHCPEIRYERGVLHFNPGSAGPQRPARPVTMGLIEVDGASLRPEVVSLVV